MKRFVTLLCLVLGVSVASFANAISTGTSNLLGPNAGLVDFESSSFPIGSFSSLASFNIPTANGTVVASISFGGSGGTGTTGAVNQQFSSFYGGTGKYLINVNNPTDNLSANNATGAFARTLTITFSTPVSEFLLDYLGNDSRTAPGGTTVNPALNFFTVNGGSTQYSLSTTTGTQRGQSGYTTVGDSNGVTQINSVTFSINGFDSGSTQALDVVLFDNLRVFTTSGTQGSSSAPSSSSSAPSGVPEPSTYALVGAGLAALAYVRRKK